MLGSKMHTGVFKTSPNTTSIFIALSIAAILLTSIGGFWLIIRQNGKLRLKDVGMVNVGIGDVQGLVLLRKLGILD